MNNCNNIFFLNIFFISIFDLKEAINKGTKLNNKITKRTNSYLEL